MRVMRVGRFRSRRPPPIRSIRSRPAPSGPAAPGRAVRRSAQRHRTRTPQPHRRGASFVRGSRARISGPRLYLSDMRKLYSVWTTNHAHNSHKRKQRELNGEAGTRQNAPQVANTRCLNRSRHAVSSRSARCGHIGRTGPNVQRRSAPMIQSDPASTADLPERCDRIAQGCISSGLTNTSLAVIAA